MYINVYKAGVRIREWINLDSSLFCSMLLSSPTTKTGKFHIQAFNNEWQKLDDFYSNQLPFEPIGSGYRKS
jgi:hypothetical protein